MKKIILCGIPSDENSSFMHGSALAPKRIRENLHAGSTNFIAESGIDILSGKQYQLTNGNILKIELDAMSGAILK